MSTNIRPNLSGAFIENKPKLSCIEEMIGGVKPIKTIIKVDKKVQMTKLGDFICLSIILGFICYFIFFGNLKKKIERGGNKENTKQKLEEIKNLNYNFFK